MDIFMAGKVLCTLGNPGTAQREDPKFTYTVLILLYDKNEPQTGFIIIVPFWRGTVKPFPLASLLYL